VIASSYFQAAANTPIISTYVSFHSKSNGPGQNINLTIRDNAIILENGMHAVNFDNGSPVMLLNNLVSTNVASFHGTENCFMVAALNNFNEVPAGSLFDGVSPSRVALNTLGAALDPSLLATRLSIGDGTPISKHLSGTIAWSPAPLPNNSAVWIDVTVIGAKVDNTVAVGFSKPLPGGVLMTGSVSAANKVTVTLFNKTGALLNLGPGGKVRADVWQH
jgi:hypothetical protein